uniref:Uncharacterized protein n=1 Tax=Shewanella decolorationis TaxID=256839 RepID=A0A5B8R1W3_9GAMM
MLCLSMHKISKIMPLKRHFDESKISKTKNIQPKVKMNNIPFYTNHIKYLISSEPHRYLNPRRIDEEMVILFLSQFNTGVRCSEAPEGRG